MNSAMPQPSGRCIEESVEIDASAERVWAVLADVESWGNWNPVYPQASGQLVEDGTIKLSVALPGSSPRPMTASVFFVDEGRAVQFGASVFGGLLRARRYIEIAPNTAGTCRVRNGEAISGLLGGVFARLGGAAMRIGLRQQNIGLKGAAELEASVAAQ
jgi:hypothetical protein